MYAIRSYYAEVITDATIHTTIKSVFENQKYILDPHGAVAYRALEHQLVGEELGVFLASYNFV